MLLGNLTPDARRIRWHPESPHKHPDLGHHVGMPRTDSEGDAELAETTNALLAFLDGVDATLDSHTQMLLMARIETTSVQAFERLLKPYTEDQHWSYATMIVDGVGRRAMAMPTRDIGPQTGQLFGFVEVHQLMVVWWLTAAWRAEQLVEASRMLSERSLVVPAAACARGLVETTAQLRADAVKVAEAWNRLKKSTDPARIAETSLSGCTELVQLLLELTIGGKFDDKVPDLQAAYGRLKRSNVLGAVEKLTGIYGVTWQEDYQWLCNVVHPSVGNYFAFSSPAFRHESGSHLHVWFAGGPIQAVSPTGEARRVGIIEAAISRSGTRSARALLVSLDDALQILDDVALTTRAAEIATFDYWRNIAVRDAQALCPCRSGHRAYRCDGHRFGQPGPMLHELPPDQQA